jgi:hypothetical protein
MKIFLSWSKPRSHAVAEALNDWLKRVIQAVKPFYSPDIEKGANWSKELDTALEGTRFGIICLTPDNLDSTWIHYEAGALSKTPDALIWTFLHGINHGNVPQPLGKFQHTVAEKDDVFKLLMSINKRLADVDGEPLDIAVLRDSYERYWPDLEGKLKAAESAGDLVEKPIEERAILLEILETVRDQQRIVSSTLRAYVNTNPEAHFRIVLPEGVSILASDALQIHLALRAKYPDIQAKFRVVGETTRIELYYAESSTASSGRHILEIIEGITGISGLEIRNMKLTSMFAT